jgi:hypothetical protein
MAQGGSLKEVVKMGNLYSCPSGTEVMPILLLSAESERELQW